MAFLGASWRSWADSGAILRPSGDHLGPFRAMLGPSWDHLGTVLGHLGPSWAILGPSWDGLGPEVWPEWLGSMCVREISTPFWANWTPKTLKNCRFFKVFVNAHFLVRGLFWRVWRPSVLPQVPPSPSKSLQVRHFVQEGP